jgi:hypothetical protein
MLTPLCLDMKGIGTTGFLREVDGRWGWTREGRKRDEDRV